MPLFKQPRGFNFTKEHPVEKHFHDHDETWIVTGGSAKAFMVDREGNSQEFMIEKGDIWMVEAGIEHGCEPGEEGCIIFPFAGTIPQNSHKPGHYYMEKENYMPTLCVEKKPLDRYTKGNSK